jgi:hypothetical protein
MPYVQSAPDNIKLTINPALGTFTGSFLDPGAHLTRTFAGALLQTGQVGGGLFESGTETMSLELQP